MEKEAEPNNTIISVSSESIVEISSGEDSFFEPMSDLRITVVTNYEESREKLRSILSASDQSSIEQARAARRPVWEFFNSSDEEGSSSSSSSSDGSTDTHSDRPEAERSDFVAELRMPTQERAYCAIDQESLLHSSYFVVSNVGRRGQNQQAITSMHEEVALRLNECTQSQINGIVAKLHSSRLWRQADGHLMQRRVNFTELLERGIKFKITSLEQLGEILWPVQVPTAFVQRWVDDLENHEETASAYVIMTNRKPNGVFQNHFPALWLWLRLE